VQHLLLLAYRCVVLARAARTARPVKGHSLEVVELSRLNAFYKGLPLVGSVGE
jgi:hypothetical protein